MISICIPSRGRPELYARTRNTAIENAANNVEVICYTNSDDPEIDKYKNTITGPALSACHGWNKAASIATGDILMVCGDAEVFTTLNWDVKIEEEFAKHRGPWMVAPDDGRSTDGTPHYFVNREWYNTLGWICHPMFYHWHVDTYARELAIAADVFSWRRDVVVTAKKIRKDNTAKLSRENRIVYRDDAAIEWARKHLMHLEVEKIHNGIH